MEDEFDVDADHQSFSPDDDQSESQLENESQLESKCDGAEQMLSLNPEKESGTHMAMASASAVAVGDVSAVRKTPSSTFMIPIRTSRKVIFY